MHMTPNNLDSRSQKKHTEFSPQNLYSVYLNWKEPQQCVKSKALLKAWPTSLQEQIAHDLVWLTPEIF